MESSSSNEGRSFADDARHLYTKVKNSSFLNRYWVSMSLILIFALGLYIRSQSLGALSNCIDGMVCLQALDPFFIYRTSLELMNNNFHFFNDMMRYFPTGVHASGTYPVVLYLPAVVYSIISMVLPGLTYLSWAQYYPAIMGALMVPALYLLGKELFNRKVGLLAAFFVAVNPATLYRTAAGFIEKEPTAMVFLILAMYFFVHALKNDSILSSVNAGLSILMATLTWGGSNILVLILGMISGILLFFNMHPRSLYKAYPLMMSIPLLVPALAGLNATMSYSSNYGLLCVGVIGLILIRYLSEKKKLVSNNSQKYVVPGACVLGGLLLIVGSFFSTTLASLFRTIMKLMNWSEGVIGSTVAENNPATWGDIQNQLGAEYASRFIPQLDSIIPYLSLWVFMLVGIVFLTYKIYKTRDWKYIFALVLILATIYASLSRIRVIFLLGAPASLIGAYGLYGISRLVNRIDLADMINRQQIFGVGTGQVKRGLLAAFMILVLAVSLLAGLSFARSIGPSFNSNWQDAMQFLKTETPEDSVILSWWDYGYWFETAGERAAVADGGNTYASTINPLLANGFIQDNVSELKRVIEYFPADYVVVDYTLIGKFSAMSKIGHDGEEVNSFVPLRQVDQIRKDNKTIMAYQLGTNSIYVPVDDNGAIAGDIKFMTPQGTAYMSGICSEEGFIDLDPPEPVFDGCLVFSNYGVYLPYPTKEAGLSNFANLYLYDGSRIPYLEKVFDNNEIKIFRYLDEEEINGTTDVPQQIEPDNVSSAQQSFNEDLSVSENMSME